MKFAPEVRKRAIRLVFEQRGEQESRWAAIETIATKVGCTAETLRGWMRQHEHAAGLCSGVANAARERIEALGCALRERRQVNEILRQASAYVAPAGLDRLCTAMKVLIDERPGAYAVEPMYRVLPVARRRTDKPAP